MSHRRCKPNGGYSLALICLLAGCKESRECRLNSDCAEEERCVEGLCTLECREDRDCKPDEACRANRCEMRTPIITLCMQTANCPSGQLCQAGVCGVITIVHGDAGVSVEDASIDGGSPSPDGGPLPDAAIMDGGSTGLPYGAVCMRASDCASMFCLGDASAMSGRCTIACTADLDCFYPDRCVEITGAGFFCGPSTSGLASGEPCPNGPATCSTGLCIAVPPAPAVCTHQCSPLPSCPAGMICAPVADGSGGALAVCVPGSGSGFGETCTMSSACASGLCVGVTSPGVCTSFCDQIPCPAGWSCESVDTFFVCAPGASAGGAFGDRCMGATECTSGLCLNDARLGFAFCTAPCVSDADCAQIAGLACVLLSSGDQVCAAP